MAQALGPRGLDAFSHLSKQWHDRLGGGRRQPAQAHVEGLGGDVLHGQIRGGAFKSGINRRDHRRMIDARGGQMLQFVGQPGTHFWNDVQAEDLDGHQLVMSGIERPKNRSQNAAADLMQDAKWAECRRRDKSGGIVEWQRRNS